MVEEISLLLGAAKSLLGIAKDAKDLIPDSNDKDGIEKAISTAERELAIAEAATAKSLGYAICQCSWPPKIMLFKGNHVFQCDQCGHKIDKSPTPYKELPPSDWRL